jgi:hypothetical protein
MTWNRGGVLGVALAAAFFAGCTVTQDVHVQVLAPTAEEGKALAQGQLDQKISELAAEPHAKGAYHAAGSARFKVKVLPQNGGGQLYEVTASEKAERPR